MKQDSNDRSQNRRILVIDDNVSIHDDFRKILQPGTETQVLDEARAALFGDEPLAQALVRFELDYANQGQAALALVQVARQEDGLMRWLLWTCACRQDGLETIERIWGVDAEIQTVICTAYTDHSWDDIVRRLGYDDRLLILQKPFSSIEVSQLAASLTRKWNLALLARQRLAAAEAANFGKSQFLPT